MSGMEYGGITPVGLPEDWRLFIDGAVAERATVLIGSGVRHSKLLVPGALLVALPGAERVENLGVRPRLSRSVSPFRRGQSSGSQPRESRTMLSPSLMVGWVMTASRTCCHFRPPSIAIWMLVTTSLASAPMMAAPRMRSVWRQ